ncbi:MAG: hypothetical protein ACWA6R_12820 [Nitrosomonas sp.]
MASLLAASSRSGTALHHHFVPFDDFFKRLMGCFQMNIAVPPLSELPAAAYQDDINSEVVITYFDAL